MGTGIEWTDETWNPVTGCAKVSQGCKHCYAERMWKRLSLPNMPYEGRAFTDVQCHPDRLTQPLRWVKPRRIFVNSMSDLFHPDVPFEFIDQVFAVMSVTTRHTFQVLTKRPERMLEWAKRIEADGGCSSDLIVPSDDIPWEPCRGNRGGCDNCGPTWPFENVWLGVSVEDQQAADERIPLLLNTPAAKRFLSIEPMLGPIELDNVEYAPGDFLNVLSLEEWVGLEGEPEVQNSPGAGALVDWVIVGGESGPNARPMHPGWVRSIRDACFVAQVPFFFKQWGEWAPHRAVAGGDEGGDLRRGHVRYLEGDGREPDGHFRKGDAAVAKVGKKKAGRDLDGRTWDEVPA